MKARKIYLWRKVVCFVLFCFVLLCHAEISQTTGILCQAFGIFQMLSRIMSRGALTWFGLRLFGATMWNLLIIESFSQSKTKQNLKMKKCIGIWEQSCSCCCCWKSPWWDSDLIEFNFIIFRAKVWKILNFLSGFFCCWKFKQIAKKIGFGRKNQLSSQCVHIDEFGNFQFSKCEK